MDTAPIGMVVGDKNIFSKDYIIISVPRFILIAPDGSIIDSNAPRPSGDIRTLLNKFICNYEVAEYYENGVSSKAWFDKNGKWVMTDSDLKI